MARRNKKDKVVFPNQPTYLDENSTLRFRENGIVEFLVEIAEKHGYDLNKLATMDFKDEDWAQFSQLTGYSVSGWGGLSYVLRACPDAEEAIYSQRANGDSYEQTTIKILTEKLNYLKETLAKPIAVLYNIHEDDLKEQL